MSRPIQHVVHMPGAREIVRRASGTLVAASILPMAVFYLCYELAGLRVAVGATVGFYYLGLLVRAVRRKPVLGAAALAAGLLTIRGIVMLFTGSAVLYFLQPVAGTIATGTAIALTALTGRPLLERLAHDFCPLSPDLTRRLKENRFFHYVSALWALTYMVNAAGTVWLLYRSSMSGFLMLKTVLSPSLTIIAVIASYLTFRFMLRKDGVVVRWGARPAVA